MKKLTIVICILLALFAVLLSVGVALGNAWVAVSSLLPLLVATVTVFYYRYFK